MADMIIRHKSPRYGELTPIGYWKSEYDPSFPQPQEFVDSSWDPGDREKVAKYLEAGRVHVRWRGPSVCRFECEASKKNLFLMGTTCLTDGTYVWPEGFAHYIRYHDVKPPEEFIQHVLVRG